MATPDDVVTFWTQAGYDRWFAKDDEFDADFHGRFLDDHVAAARRERDDWSASPEGSLALMILLDQFPRNCFRGTAHMFATDPLARMFARKALDAGHHRALDGMLPLFLYLPLMHSEDIGDQNIAVSLCAPLGGKTHESALEHREIIERFGRFPHRNPMLGRLTTQAEQAFLAGGGFSG
jgi:uncharacterized protein (DUF924 family)